MNLTDFLKAINQTKEAILDGDDMFTEKEYLPFVVNRCLSYFPDTIFQANEMNRRHGADNKLQFDYLLHGIRPRKRFSAWIKNEKPEDLDAVKQFFGYSNTRAKEVLSLLSESDIERIKHLLDTGGVRGRS